MGQIKMEQIANSIIKKCYEYNQREQMLGEIGPTWQVCTKVFLYIEYRILTDYLSSKFGRFCCQLHLISFLIFVSTLFLSHLTDYNQISTQGGGGGMAQTLWKISIICLTVWQLSSKMAFCGRFTTGKF